MSDTKHCRVLIVGSGPAGYSAAVYAARANLNPVMVSGFEQGGQLMTTTDVDNWPGDHDGLQGPDLMERLKDHALRFNTEIINDHITSVDFSKRPFTLQGGDTTYTADAIIISTGATAKYLGLESEEAYKGKGVSACATCDGFFFRDKKVLVVGGGDSAMEEATFLTKFASEVVLIHRRDEFRASKIMIDRALANPKISVEYNSNVDDIIGTKETGVTAVRLSDTISGAKRDIVCDGIFMAIGHIPNTKLFNGSIDLDNAGYIITNSDTTYTNLEGVFACGDVQDHVYRQAVTAAGTGCMAAIDAERWLEQETE